MTEDSGRTAWPREARAYLRDADPVLARLIAGQGALLAALQREDVALPGDLALRDSAAFEPTG